MNIPTIIGTLIIILILAAVFTHGFKGKKKSGGCGGSCGSCPYSGQCHH